MLKFLQICDKYSSKDLDPDPGGQLITDPPDPDLDPQRCFQQKFC
jgi:hypothetical protein